MPTNSSGVLELTFDAYEGPSTEIVPQFDTDAVPLTIALRLEENPHDVIEIGQPYDVTEGSYDVAARKRYGSPAPKECEIDYIPTDIRSYMAKMVPAMRLVAANATKLHPNHDDINDLINSFIAYFLDNDRQGLPRYMRYRTDLSPRPKYHKYFLSQFQMSCKNRATEIARQMKFVGIQDYDSEGGDFVEPGRIHYSQLQRAALDKSECDSAEEGMVRDDVLSSYERALHYLAKMQESYRRLDSISWQAHAYDIFLAVYREQTLNCISDEIKISRTSMNKWWANVQAEVRAFLRENPFEA